MFPGNGSNNGHSNASGWSPLFTDSRTEPTKLKVKVKVMLRPTVSRPVCIGIKHPCVAYDQIFITVRQLRVCWCGSSSLTRGRVCRLSESQSAVASLLSVCTVYILHVIKRMYICTDLGQSHLGTAELALLLVAPATTAVYSHLNGRMLDRRQV
jgi:hypothetical protein